MTKTLEERVADLEAACRQDDNLIKAAAGQLRKAKDARNVEDIIRVLLIVAGQLEAVGKGE